MDSSWMGVGSDMFMREIAALVPAFSAMPGNTESSAAELAAAAPLAVANFLTGALTAAAWPLRRVLKHVGQYTGLPWLGRKGTVVAVPQSAQAAKWRWVRTNGRGRVDRDSTGIGGR